MSAPLAKIRLRDFLMPERLLAATDVDDNPFVRHGERRRRRAWRIAVRLLLGLILAAFCVACLSPQWFGIDLGVWMRRGWSWRRDAGQWAVGPVGLSGGWFFVAFSAASFVLLRYNLFVNDQSHHMKSIAHEQLEHLMLSRLGPDEYFLHHFLLFCLRYDVVVAFAAIVTLCTGGGMIAGEWEWIRPPFWLAHLVLFGICLLAWVGGALQYVVEWRLFAASRVPWLRAPVSMALSALLAVPVSLMGLAVREADMFAGLFLLVVVFFVCALIVHSLGSRLFKRSETILWNRFVGKGSDEARLLPHQPHGRKLALLAKAVLLPLPSRAPWLQRPTARDCEVAAATGIILAGLVLVARQQLEGGMATLGSTLFSLFSQAASTFFALVVARLVLSASGVPPFHHVRAATTRLSLLAIPSAGLGVAQGIQVAAGYGGRFPIIVGHFAASYCATLLTAWFVSVALALSALKLCRRLATKTRFVCACLAVVAGNVWVLPFFQSMGNLSARLLWQTLFYSRYLSGSVEVVANLATMSASFGIPLIASMVLAAWAARSTDDGQPVSPC